MFFGTDYTSVCISFYRCNDIDMSKALSTLILNTVKGGTDSSHQVSVLLHLEIPLLFSPDVKGVSTVRQTFKNSLMKKIETQGLRKVVQTCFLEWLVGRNQTLLHIIHVFSSK